MTKVQPSHIAPAATMKALIIYDDIACAARANAALQHAAHSVDIIVEWDIRPLRLDALQRLPAAHEALVAASGAHLIVFAGKRAQSFPFWLERWLERWAATRRIEDVTLAVMNRRGDGLQSSTPSPLLTEFAERHGLTFIIEEDSADETESITPADSANVLWPLASAAQSQMRPIQLSAASCRSLANHNSRAK